jgi:hypothetical protein
MNLSNMENQNGNYIFIEKTLCSMVDGFEAKLTTPTNQHALVGQMFILSNSREKHLQHLKIFEAF